MKLEAQDPSAAEVSKLGHNLCMHVAATRPLSISREDLPSQEVERERGILESQAAGEGKPAAVIADSVNLLSNASVLTNDNEQSQIEVGRTLNIARTDTLTNGSTATTAPGPRARSRTRRATARIEIRSFHFLESFPGLFPRSIS